jgi:hypothetical protein
MERSTALQLNNSFLGFEIEYALCNRDKKLVFTAFDYAFGIFKLFPVYYNACEV